MATYRSIVGLKIKKRSSDPSNPVLGEMWYNTTSGTLKVRGFGSATWSSGNTAPGAYMSFAGAGTQSAYIKTMGNDGSPAPNPVANDTAIYDGTNWTSGPSNPLSRRDPGGFGIETAAIFFGGQKDTPEPQRAITAQTWDGSSFTSVPNMNHRRRTCNGTGLITTGLIVGGAGDPSGSPEGAMTNVESYNGSSFSNETAIPTAFRGGGQAGSEPAAICVGGVSPASTSTFEYDGSSWTSGGTANTARSTTFAGSAGTQTAALIYGGGPSVTQAESYDGTSFAVDSTMASGSSGRGNQNSQAYSTTAIYVGNPNPPGSAPGASTVNEYTAAAAATTTVTVS